MYSFYINRNQTSCNSITIVVLLGYLGAEWQQQSATPDARDLRVLVRDPDQSRAALHAHEAGSTIDANPCPRCTMMYSMSRCYSKKLSVINQLKLCAEEQDVEHHLK